MKTYIGGLCLLLLVSLQAQGQKGEGGLIPVTVLLDWNINTNHVGLYLAQQKGFFAEEGLEVSIPPVTEVSAMQLVGNDKAHFGIGYQEFLTFARANSQPPVPVVAIAAILAHNTSGFAAARSSGIRSVADFKGRRLESSGSAMTRNIVDTITQPYGFSSQDMVLIPAGQLNFFQAIAADVYDIAWIFMGWDGVNARLQNVDLYVEYLKDLNPELDYYTPLFFTSQKMIDQQPDVVQKFVNAIARGYSWAQQNPLESADVLLAVAPDLDRELVRESLLFLQPWFSDQGQPWGRMKPSIWAGFTGWLRRKDFIPQSYSEVGSYTNAFIDRAPASANKLPAAGEGG